MRPVRRPKSERRLTTGFRPDLTRPVYFLAHRGDVKKGQTMKTITTLVSAALAVSLLAGTASAAFADPRDRDNHREFMRDAPRHEFMRGDRFVMERGYVTIRDWRDMRLSRPHFDAHWVRAGAQFLLISNRTGRVLDVVIAR